jgi:hypothetical protein
MAFDRTTNKIIVDAGGSNTHVQYNSSGSLAGSVNLVWDNTNNRLGIGTDEPGQALDVAGSIRATRGTSTEPQLILDNSQGAVGTAARLDLITDSGANDEVRVRFIGDSEGADQAGGRLIIQTNSAGDSLVDRLTITSGGDCQWYEDTGTTPKMTWDASASSLGIGVASPSDMLELSGSSPEIRLTDSDLTSTYSVLSGNGGHVSIQADASNQTGGSRITMEVDGTEHLRITSGGSVGIGESGTPDTRLHVFGTTSAGDQNVIKVGSTASGYGYMGYNSTGSVFWLSPTSATPTAGIAMTSTGVGIGTSVPSHKLHVYSATGNVFSALQTGNTSRAQFVAQHDQNSVYFGVESTAAATFTGTLANAALFGSNGAYASQIITNGAAQVTVSSSGNVGIGVTSPDTLLDLQQTSDDITGGIRIGDSADARYLNLAYDSAKGFQIQTTYSGSLKLGTNSTDRMSITSGGLVGIGTSVPTGAKLDIRTDSTTIIDAGATLNVEENTAWTQGIAFYINNADTYAADYASACIGVVNSGSGITISSGARVVDNPSNSNGYKTLSGTTAAVYRQKDGAHIFYSNTGIAAANTLFTPTERMQITSGGDCQWNNDSNVVKMIWDASESRLGIGTTEPASELHVKTATTSGVTNTSQVGIRSEDARGGGAIYGGPDMNHSILFRYGQDDTVNTMNYHSYGSHRFYTNGSIQSQVERLRITSGGVVEVKGGVVKLGTADVSSGHLNAYENMTFNVDTDNDDTNRYFAWHFDGSDGSGTELMRISESGTVALTEVAAAATSVGGRGQIWVKNDDPNTLWFTDDLGNDKQLDTAEIGIAVSDETTALTTGDAKATLLVPRNMTITEVKASLTGADTGAYNLEVDVRYNATAGSAGTTIFSADLEITAGDYYATKTGATAFVGSASSKAVAENGALYIDINDSSGSAIFDCTGLKVWLLGYWN